MALGQPNGVWNDHYTLLTVTSVLDTPIGIKTAKITSVIFQRFILERKPGCKQFVPKILNILIITRNRYLWFSNQRVVAVIIITYYNSRLTALKIKE